MSHAFNYLTVKVIHFWLGNIHAICSGTLKQSPMPQRKKYTPPFNGFCPQFLPITNILCSTHMGSNYWGKELTDYLSPLSAGIFKVSSVNSHASGRGYTVGNVYKWEEECDSKNLATLMSHQEGKMYQVSILPAKTLALLWKQYFFQEHCQEKFKVEFNNEYTCIPLAIESWFCFVKMANILYESS